MIFFKKYPYYRNTHQFDICRINTENNDTLLSNKLVLCTWTTLPSSLTLGMFCELFDCLNVYVCKNLDLHCVVSLTVY